MTVLKRLPRELTSIALILVCAMAASLHAQSVANGSGTPALAPASPAAPPVTPAGTKASRLDVTVSPEAQQLNTRLEAAFRLNMVADPAKAQAAFEGIRVDAERLGLTRQVASALRGMAAVESAQERHAQAKTLIDRALELYRLAGDDLGEARALRQLGSIQPYLGGDGLPLLYRARDAFKRLGDKQDLALTWVNIVYQMTNDQSWDNVRGNMVDEALVAVRDSGEREFECVILHNYGDQLFTVGNYNEAYPLLMRSLACYQEVGKQAEKGRVLVSLGRVQRAHGQYERALGFYQQAYALQQEAHDEPAALQSLNAIGVAYAYMGRLEDARRCYQEALDRSRALGSPRYIGFMTGSLGNTLFMLGRTAEATDMLKESIALEKNNGTRGHRYYQLAQGYLSLGQLDEAMAAINHALDLVVEDPDIRARAFSIRASIEQRMDRLQASDADMREALRLVEDLRTHTLARDFMKRGFGDNMQEIYGIAIDIQSRRGDARGALETAELARARAFLDLLASRDGESSASAGGTARKDHAPVDSGVPPALLTATALPSIELRPFSAFSLPTRGTAAHSDAALAPYLSSPALDIASPQRAAAPTVDEMIATAARLHSSLLVYWVGFTSTVAWVVSPTGQIHAETINIDSTRLSDLVRATTSPLKDGGAALMLMGASQRQAWRDLYDLLIKPVRDYLPATPGSLITIVPHGPLFQVSFAGLRDENGKYLIESYRLHYTPSVGVLAYTVPDARPQRATVATKALLVGDPAPPASDPGDEELSALPWARREVTEIGTVLGARQARVITEQAATEARVREEIESADLLHFATHGVIRQSESMSSFLALARPDAATAPASTAAPAPASTSLRRTDALTDGKLTADEVYGLRLHADLVVLSACGTALGPMSGDGVIGFTRAFLYAGARSVIATEWNVPDQTGYEVMRRFYRFRKASNDTSDALRDAQLAVLNALRAGKLLVQTPGGAVALRENPLFWAGFVLVGKP